ncbi:MAG TPA: hypothetical protein VK871_04800 [Candidatus Limnocylindrales bacterium]|nr:hypothetical protein [Candidatus Limnocylindrales bacterium]
MSALQRPASGRSRETASRPGLAVAALAAGGWLLLLVSVPVAIFLTWWGDCFEEACPAATDLDRAVYVFDFAAWLILPALAFGAYRGWRLAAIGLVGIGLAVGAQVVAAMLGARGFQAFPIVLPAAAIIALSGLIALRPSLGGGIAGSDASTTRTGLIGLAVVALVVVAIAFQGVVTGSDGGAEVIVVLAAVSLAVIAVLAFLNRNRRPRADARRSRRR